MIKQPILAELKQFIYAVSNHRGIPKNISSAQIVRSSLTLLEDLPASREVVLEYFALVFDISVKNYVSFVGKEPQRTTPPEDEVINDVQEALENLVTKGPPAWCPLIASWSLELVGRLSDKYWPSRKLDIGAACNLWLNCGAMRCLLGLMASCFRKMNNAEAETCIATLLAIFTKYSPTFDWVVARLGGCYPLKIISQILQCGLKRFSDDPRCRFDSEIGILSYLSFAHEQDLKHAIKDLFEDGFNLKKPIHVHIIPYIMQISSCSDILLQPIISVFLDLFNDSLLEVIVQKTNLWLNNFVFRDMQPSLNNIALKVKTNGTQLLLTVAKIADKYFWCQDFIEYTIQELEQLILENRSCPLMTDLSRDDAKSLLWRSCISKTFIEQQTAVRLLLLVASQFPHIYHQTIAELLVKSYELNKTSIGSLIRVFGGLSGTVEYAEIKPGIEMALERVLLQKQFHYHDNQTECLNAIKNLVMILKIENANGSPYLKHHPITSALNECLPKLLNILECLLNRLAADIDTIRPNEHLFVTNLKRPKLETGMEVDQPPETGFNNLSKCADLVHNMIHLLNLIEAGSKQIIINMIEVLKLAHLTVKYLFWTLTEKSPTVRTIAVSRAYILLQRQCSARKAARTACLRDLVEGALFLYPNLFGAQCDDGCVDEDPTCIPENEKLIVLNQKQGFTPNASRSALHAGVIGKGLKPEIMESGTERPDPEIQSMFLKAIDSCCQDQDKRNIVDGYSTVSLLLVEMVSTDVMYNGLPFPDEEFTKVTMERDLQIRRTFKSCPILWGIISVVATHRSALCFSSVLLRALCASFLHQWRAKNVNRYQPPSENPELLTATVKLLEILSIGQLLPPPLSTLHMVIRHLDAPEIALVLKECVWNYLKDNVPSPALFQCDSNGLYWRNPNLAKPPPPYVDPLRNIMQKKLPKLGSFYHEMFAMSDFDEKNHPSSPTTAPRS